MNHKKQRLGTKLMRAAGTGACYRDINVFIGGTGAIGGTALLQMLSLYEEMMSINPPSADEVPILVTTGATGGELHTFTRRLFRFIESRDGASKHPQRVASGYLTRSGIFIALERFRLTMLPVLEEFRNLAEGERSSFIGQLLSSLGKESDPLQVLVRAISNCRPITEFLKCYQPRHFKDTTPTRFRSVTIGIPIPSLVASHLAHLAEIARYIPELTAPDVEELRDAFRRAFRDDLSEIKTNLAEEVLVAHTTAVGGMYDHEIVDGEEHRRIRLGFAHS